MGRGLASETAKLVLGGGPKPKQRRGRRSDWTDAMAGKFVAVIAETCNVTLAAQAIKRSISSVYKQRSTNATFRAAWDAALTVGYSQLEMMMLERALHGVEKTVVARDGTTTVMREYSDRVALTLLRMHRESVAASEDGVAEDEAREACERIVAKLQRLRECALRDEAAELADKGGADPGTAGEASPRDERAAVETKEAIDRLEMIRWALCARGGRGRA